MPCLLGGPVRIITEAMVKELYTSPGALEYKSENGPVTAEVAHGHLHEASKMAVWCENSELVLHAIKALYSYAILACHSWVFNCLDFGDKTQRKSMFKDSWPTLAIEEACKQIENAPEAASKVLDEVFRGDEETAAQVESCWANYLKGFLIICNKSLHDSRRVIYNFIEPKLVQDHRLLPKAFVGRPPLLQCFVTRLRKVSKQALGGL